MGSEDRATGLLALRKLVEGWILHADYLGGWTVKVEDNISVDGTEHVLVTAKRDPTDKWGAYTVLDPDRKESWEVEIFHLTFTDAIKEADRNNGHLFDPPEGGKHSSELAREERERLARESGV